MNLNGVIKIIETLQKSSKVPHNMTNYSKISLEFFQKIDKYLGLSDSRYGENEWVISLPENNPIGKDFIFLDYYNDIIKLVIEFYGDYWHGNPKIYDVDDYIDFPNKERKSVAEIWSQDSIRENYIKEYLRPNFFYIVWESEQEKMLKTIVQDVNKLKVISYPDENRIYNEEQDKGKDLD